MSKLDKLRDNISNSLASNLEKNITNQDTVSKIVATRMKKDYIQLNSEQIIQVFNHAFLALIGDISKVLLILLIAHFLNIFQPVLIISLTFMSLRMFAGGVHMDTFLKCLVSTAVMFLGVGYIGKILTSSDLTTINVMLIGFISFVISSVLANKYAPRDTENKRITDLEKIQKFKLNTLIYIFALYGLSMILSLNYKAIAVNISLGMLLEMLTTTPVVVKLFAMIRDGINALYNKSEGV